MWIRLVCPSCGKAQAMPGEAIGQTAVRCVSCGQVFVPAVKEAGSAPSSAASAPADGPPVSVPSVSLPAEEAAGPTTSCPGCGRDLPPGSVLCVGCGWHLQLGKRVGGGMSRPASRRVPTDLIRSALVLLVMVGILGGGGYLWYDALTKRGLKERFDEIAAPSETEKSKRDGRARVSKHKRRPSRPAVRSRLVVRNERFPLLKVLLNEERLGEAPQGQTVSFEVPLPRRNPRRAKISLRVTFEAARAAKIPKAVRKILADGAVFTGTKEQGVEITIPGPPKGLWPRAGAKIRGLSWARVKMLGGGKYGVPELEWRGRVLKPTTKDGMLRLKSKGESLDALYWTAQECRVADKNGLVLYDPAKLKLQVKEIPLNEPPAPAPAKKALRK